MLAAKAEYIRKHIVEAERLAMQSMLISNQKDEDFFDLAISFFVQIGIDTIECNSILIFLSWPYRYSH